MPQKYEQCLRNMDNVSAIWTMPQALSNMWTMPQQYMDNASAIYGQCLSNMDNTSAIYGQCLSNIYIYMDNALIWTTPDLPRLAALPRPGHRSPLRTGGRGPEQPAAPAHPVCGCCQNHAAYGRKVRKDYFIHNVIYCQ